MIKSNGEVKMILFLFTKACFKMDLCPFIESETNFFTYSYIFNKKKYKGTFFSLDKCTSYSKIKRQIFKHNLVQFWQIGSKYIKNPYVCAHCVNSDELVVHVGSQGVEVFCQHSNYIPDEIYINII